MLLIKTMLNASQNVTELKYRDTTWDKPILVPSALFLYLLKISEGFIVFNMYLNLNGKF